MDYSTNAINFSNNMEDLMRKSPDEVKTEIRDNFPVLQKLFGSQKDPRPELGSFMEMYGGIFLSRKTSSDPDISSNLPSSSSSSSGGVELCMEKYREVMHKCFNFKSHSLYIFVTEKDLRLAHECGLTKVLDWLKKKEVRGEENTTNIITEDMIKPLLEKEHYWVSEVNTDRFKKHVGHSFNLEFRDGRDCLESDFSFNDNPNAGCQIKVLHDGIDNEIEKQVQNFAKMFPEAHGDGETFSKFVNNVAAALRSKLEEVGAKVKEKNKELLSTFAESHLIQVAGEFEKDMSLFLDNKSLLDVRKIGDKHENLKAEGVGKWKSKILSLNRDYSTSQQLTQLDAMMEQSFNLLWSWRREVILEENLVGWRKQLMKRMRAMGVDTDDESFQADVSALLIPFEKLIKDKVEAVTIGRERTQDCGNCNVPEAQQSRSNIGGQISISKAPNEVSTASNHEHLLPKPPSKRKSGESSREREQRKRSRES